MALSTFALELDRCASIPEVGVAFMQAIASHGFTVCACGAFLPADSGPEPHFFFQNWPAEWIALYMKRNFVGVDFGVAEARRRIAPFTWAEAKAERTLSRAERDLWQEVENWGWPDGFSVPIHGPGGYFGLVTMGGKVKEFTRELRTELHIMAFQTHERCRALNGVKAVADLPASLSPRELECMRWVAAGKTDLDIAAIMGLSGTTIKSHIDNARRKLGAQTRPQAVARLALSGLS